MAEIVALPKYYLFSSARDYCGEKGLAAITLMEESGYVVVG